MWPNLKLPAKTTQNDLLIFTLELIISNQKIEKFLFKAKPIIWEKCLLLTVASYINR